MVKLAPQATFLTGVCFKASTRQGALTFFEWQTSSCESSVPCKSSSEPLLKVPWNSLLPG